MASKYPFPYETVEAGQKDNWRKLAGHDLIAILKAGWYQIMNRKDRNSEITAAFQLAKKDPAFKSALEKARKAVKGAA